MAEVRHNEFVFPGAKQGRSLTRNGLLWLFEHLGLKITSHGFRSSFRDWVAEATTFPREAAELALAHAVGDSKAATDPVMTPTASTDQAWASRWTL